MCFGHVLQVREVIKYGILEFVIDLFILYYNNNEYVRGKNLVDLLSELEHLEEQGGANS